MNRLGIVLMALAACRGDRNPENSALCGFAALAAGTVVLDQFSTGTTLIEAAPAGLQGTVPARVIGRGTARGLAAKGPDALGVVVGYEGEGFPDRSGFGVALVDDSSEVFRGIVIFESDGPTDYPQIGTISSATRTIPLYGMRVRWSAVSEDRCPLFAPVRDSVPGPG